MGNGYAWDMKFIDLSKLDLKRLKAYRNSILNKITPYVACWCGDPGCSCTRDENKSNPDYKNLCLVRDRVNKELAKRQIILRNKSKNLAHVRTLKEPHPAYKGFSIYS